MVHHKNTQDIGSLLRERRYLLSVGIDEVAAQIDVPAKHLRRIEKGQWHALPSAVYTQGFVRKYARALGMDADRAVRKYKEEADVSAELSGSRVKGVAVSGGAGIKTLATAAVSKITRRVAIVLIFLAVLGYIGYQLSVVFAQPALTVTQPNHDETIVSESSLMLAGITDPGVQLFLNAQRLEIESDGSFQRTVELLPGINTLEIAAESRFGERTTSIRTVIYKEPERPLFMSEPTDSDEQQQSGTSTPPITETGGATTSTSTPE